MNSWFGFRLFMKNNNVKPKTKKEVKYYTKHQRNITQSLLKRRDDARRD
jgi:hypothetical protein